MPPVQTNAASDLPRVSVALATYNGAQYIDAQLNSLAAQTLLPAELVVSDDGSSDDTLAIVRTFSLRAPFPVRIVDKTERLGFGDNFLFAVAQCQYDVIALCDQDDVWLPDKLRQGVRRLVADDSLMSLHRLTLTDALLAPIGIWDQGITADRTYEPLELDPWSGWGNTMIFRRSLATLVPPGQRPRQPEANRPLTHDIWLYILAAGLGRVSHIVEPLILYRQHGGNALGMTKPRLGTRLRTMATVPVESYRERDVFFGALATTFDALSRHADTTLAARAEAAAARYRIKQGRARLRARIHDCASIRDRAVAFWRLYAVRNAADHSPVTTASKASIAKDVVLGVTGWGRHV